MVGEAPLEGEFLLTLIMIWLGGFRWKRRCVETRERDWGSPEGDCRAWRRVAEESENWRREVEWSQKLPRSVGETIWTWTPAGSVYVLQITQANRNSKDNLNRWCWQRQRRRQRQKVGPGAEPSSWEDFKSSGEGGRVFKGVARMNLIHSVLSVCNKNICLRILAEFGRSTVWR